MWLFFDRLPTALPCTFHLVLVARIAHLETRLQINPDFKMRENINDQFLLSVIMLGKNQHFIFALETFKSGKLQSEFAVWSQVFSIQESVAFQTKGLTNS
jgi:hypothetical protein